MVGMLEQLAGSRSETLALQEGAPFSDGLSLIKLPGTFY
jgi:hypothetical protein